MRRARARNSMRARCWCRFTPATSTAGPACCASWSSRSDQELPVRHHLVFIEPDVEVSADAIDVRLGNPVLTRVLRVGMTEGDVNAGNFFVLENVADHVRAGRVGADRELAHAVAVFIRARVG